MPKKTVLIKFLLLIALIPAGLSTPPSAVHARQRDKKKTAAGSANAASSSAAARVAAETIAARELKEYLQFVAADEMEGRDTPSRGLDLTAKFIAMNLALWNVKPAGDDGTYFQRIALKREHLKLDEARMEFNGQPVAASDFVPALIIAGAASGSLVYGGHGWFVKSKNLDALKDVDVKDKIVVLPSLSFPKGVTFADIGGKQGVDFASPIEYARQKGARGILLVPGFQAASDWTAASQTALANPALSVERFASQPAAESSAPVKPIPVVTVSLGVLGKMFQGEKLNGSDVFQRKLANDPGDAFALDAKKQLSFTVATSVENLRTQNVVAVIEGGDPVLKNEYVAVGAHYDHVGKGAPGPSGRFPHPDGKTDDEIWNGADDDGSGTVAVLMMAKAFATAAVRPKRSIIFVWHAGEEKGLWGAKYFNKFPTVPSEKIVAQLNIDMIGRSLPPGDTSAANSQLSKPGEIYVIGSKVMSTQLGELSERVNNSYLKMDFNYRYDDPNDPERFFFRSDHFYYAQKGIPIIFYFNGPHVDYHRPSDHVEKIDFQKIESVARTVFMTAWELGNMPARPFVDKPLPKEYTNDDQ